MESPRIAQLFHSFAEFFHRACVNVLQVLEIQRLMRLRIFKWNVIVLIF